MAGQTLITCQLSAPYLKQAVQSSVSQKCFTTAHIIEGRLQRSRDATQAQYSFHAIAPTEAITVCLNLFSAGKPNA